MSFLDCKRMQWSNLTYVSSRARMVFYLTVQKIELFIKYGSVAKFLKGNRIRLFIIRLSLYLFNKVIFQIVVIQIYIKDKHFAHNVLLD